jgi:hypothetical protein
MILIFGNNEATTLAAPINNSVTTLTLFPGTGAAFPHPTAGQYFIMTLVDAATASVNEILWVTDVTGDVCTIQRGKENTTAISWLAGDFVSCYPTAGTQAVFIQPDQFQEGIYEFSVAAGTVNALTATITSNLTTPQDGMPLTITASGANTSGTVTLNLTMGSTVTGVKNIVRGGNQLLIVGDIPSAGYPIQLNWSATYNAWVMSNPSISSGASGIVGDIRNLNLLVTTPSFSTTITADEIILINSTGAQSIKLTNFSKTLNLSTVGAGGMDNGSPPTNNFVAIYAAYNPTTATASVFATNASVYRTGFYNGSFLPSGYIYTALIAVVPTDSSGHINSCRQIDRTLHIPKNLILSTTTSLPVAATPQSAAAAVPLNAVAINSIFDLTPLSGTGSLSVSVLDNAGSSIGESVATWYAVSPSTLVATFNDTYVANTQTFNFSLIASGITNTGVSIFISGYTI